MAEHIATLPAVASGASHEPQSILGLLRASCKAFYLYEDLRHMSDAQLKDLGLSRDQVARRVFVELFDDESKDKH